MTKNMLIIMGVAGSGKSAIGEALCKATDIDFIDGDALHPTSNIEKMSAGHPLTDKDRWPWLKIVGQRLGQSAGSLAIGCSALKRRYRDLIGEQAGGIVTFIYLDGSRDLIAKRMGQREGHFMPTELLDSQFADLEVPASDEKSIRVDISKPIDDIVSDLIAALNDRFS